MKSVSFFVVVFQVQYNLKGDICTRTRTNWTALQSVWLCMLHCIYPSSNNTVCWQRGKYHFQGCKFGFLFSMLLSSLPLNHFLCTYSIISQPTISFQIQPIFIAPAKLRAHWLIWAVLGAESHMTRLIHCLPAEDQSCTWCLTLTAMWNVLWNCTVTKRHFTQTSQGWSILGLRWSCRNTNGERVEIKTVRLLCQKHSFLRFFGVVESDDSVCDLAWHALTRHANWKLALLMELTHKIWLRLKTRSKPPRSSAGRLGKSQTESLWRQLWMQANTQRVVSWIERLPYFVSHPDTFWWALSCLSRSDTFFLHCVILQIKRGAHLWLRQTWL